METPVLTTKRLLLRRYAESDRAFAIALFGDAEVFKHAAGGALDAAKASALFDKIAPIYGEGRFAIWLVEEDGVPVGHAELKPRAGEEGLEVVYFLARSAQGRGLGTELLEAVAAFGLALSRRLIATVHPDNARSMKLLARCGFARVEKKDGDTVYFERRKPA